MRGANYISRPEQPLKPIHNSRSWHLPLLTCAGLAIAGCSETPAGTSVDANAFAKSIRLGAPVQSVRFEIVTLPENQGSGGLPGPTRLRRTNWLGIAVGYVSPGVPAESTANKSAAS